MFQQLQNGFTMHLEGPTALGERKINVEKNFVRVLWFIMRSRPVRVQEFLIRDLFSNIIFSLFGYFFENEGFWPFSNFCRPQSKKLLANLLRNFITVISSHHSGLYLQRCASGPILSDFSPNSICQYR